MRLIFFKREFNECVDNGMVEFPFLASNELTDAVLSVSDDKEKLRIISERLHSYGWRLNDISVMMERIKLLMRDPNLILGKFRE
jgi:hypothetical protein